MNSPVNDLRGASSSLGVSLHLPEGTAALLGLLVMAGGAWLRYSTPRFALRRVARIHRWEVMGSDPGGWWRAAAGGHASLASRSSDIRDTQKQLQKVGPWSEESGYWVAGLHAYQ